MPAEPEAKEQEDELEHGAHATPRNGSIAHAPDTGSGDEDEDEEEEDEPRLKYTKLTGSLTSVYRNADDTSTFVVSGDKMVRLHQRPCDLDDAY